MKNHLSSYLFISLLFLVEGCSSISDAANSSTVISFGGYYFSVPKSPDFIGASANDSLIVSFNDYSKKAVFSLNDYKNFDDYNISAETFLSVVYGSTNTKNEALNLLKLGIAENELSREQLTLNNWIIYRITYQAREYAVVYNKARPLFWVAIETTGLDMSDLMASLKEI